MKQITFSMFGDNYFFYNIEIDYNDIKKLSILFVTEYNCHPVYSNKIKNMIEEYDEIKMKDLKKILKLIKNKMKKK